MDVHMDVYVHMGIHCVCDGYGLGTLHERMWRACAHVVGVCA